MKNFFKEFKAFITKGNILDLAVAVVIGAAFNAIISSLVKNIIMPLISLVTGGVSVDDWKWVITVANEAAGVKESAVYYGLFIQAIIDFLIIAFSIFMVLRIIMRFKNGASLVASTKLTTKEYKEMKTLKLNYKDKDDLEKFREIQKANAKTEVEKKKAEVELERINNPSEKDLLFDIRELLRNQK